MGINEEFKNIEVRLRRLESNVRELVRRGRNEPTGVLAQEVEARKEPTECGYQLVRKYRQERDEALKERDALNDMVTTRWLEVCEARKQSEISLRGKAVAEHECAQAKARADALEEQLQAARRQEAHNESVYLHTVAKVQRERDAKQEQADRLAAQLQKSAELLDTRWRTLQECQQQIAKLRRALRENLSPGYADEVFAKLEKQHGL